LAQASAGTIQRRCSSCGLEWESAHYGEACPLRELEMAFLSADWFMVFSEATS
jgi:predicted transcriptional regulator